MTATLGGVDAARQGGKGLSSVWLKRRQGAQTHLRTRRATQLAANMSFSARRVRRVSSTVSSVRSGRRVPCGCRRAWGATRALRAGRGQGGGGPAPDQGSTKGPSRVMLVSSALPATPTAGGEGVRVCVLVRPWQQLLMLEAGVRARDTGTPPPLRRQCSCPQRGGPEPRSPPTQVLGQLHTDVVAVIWALKHASARGRMGSMGEVQGDRRVERRADRGPHQTAGPATPPPLHPTPPHRLPGQRHL